jgi:S1-C subfamily serine protease
MSLSNPYSSRYSQPQRRPHWPLILLVVLGSVLGFLLLERGLSWKVWPWRKPDLSASAVPRPVDAAGNLGADEQTTIDIYKTTAPSVVHINNLALIHRRNYFNLDVEQIQRGEGSGFVWDDDKGLIVTNAHVVEGADAVEVILADKERSTFETKDWVSYPDKDLAVIYVDAPKNKLKKLPKIGSSSDLEVGQNAYAIGNPFGLDQTLTTGIISALNRDIKSESGRPIQGVIQTSAAINPGNSGGPLLDRSGRLIGVNTAILSPSGTFAGIGFAMPIDEVNRVIPTMIVKLDERLKQNRGHEEVAPPRMGVNVAQDAIARQLGVTDGALILNVVPGSPAAKAGLLPTRQNPTTGSISLGDIIVSMDGKEVHSAKEVFSGLEGRNVGDIVKLTVLRNDQRKDVEVKLAPVR